MSGTSYLTTASCIVFVGNIPYGLSETQITDIFSSVGRVVCFRMVFDRETGRSKGYGFAEYIDAETAASAVRNLDNYEIMGRKLRVDYSSQGYVGKEGYPGREGYVAKDASYAIKDNYPAMIAKDASYNNESIVYNTETGYSTIISGDVTRYGVPGIAVLNGGDNGLSARYGVPNLPAPAPTITADIPIPAPTTLSLLPILPPGVEIHPNLTAPDSISKTLAAIPLPQLLHMLVQMKELATTEPVKATELLRQCPQLSYAIFQSMIMMNLIEPGVLSQLLDPSNGTSTYIQPQSTVIGAHIPVKVSNQASSIPHKPPMLHHPAPRQVTPHVPTAAQQASFYNYQTQHSSLPTHNSHPEFAGNIAHQQAQQRQRIQGMQEPDKAMLLQRVMVLTQEEISRLPAEQQQQVLLLKHRLIAEGMSGHGQAGY